MNPKQTVPLAVALAPAIAAAPAVIIGGVIGLGIIWLIKSLASDETPETDPAKTEPKSSLKTAENTRKEAEKTTFREIPAIPRPSICGSCLPSTVRNISTMDLSHVS